LEVWLDFNQKIRLKEKQKGGARKQN